MSFEGIGQDKPASVNVARNEETQLELSKVEYTKGRIMRGGKKQVRLVEWCTVW